MRDMRSTIIPTSDASEIAHCYRHSFEVLKIGTLRCNRYEIVKVDGISA